MHVTPTSIDTYHKQGTLRMSCQMLESVLGLPNCPASLDGKSECGWEVCIEIGEESYDVAIWDWRGSGDRGEWSYFGPREAIDWILSGNP